VVEVGFVLLLLPSTHFLNIFNIILINDNIIVLLSLYNFFYIY